MKAVLKVFALICAMTVTAFMAQKLFATASTVRVATHSYVATNVTTGAYVTLIASTAVASSYIEFCDTSGKVMKVATGSAGNEKDIATANVSGCIIVPYYIPANTRLSLEAATQAATTGYGVLSLIP